MTTISLQKVMNEIGQKYRFTKEAYPTARFVNPTEFAIYHSSLHMQKTVGKIAAELEACDHGGKMDEEKLRMATAQMFITTLKLAEVLGMSASKLVVVADKAMNQK